jgi:hypothetical protein
MNSEIFIQLIQLGTIVVGFLGVVVTLRSHRRQMDAQMFIEFSSRVHHVIQALPPHVWMGHDIEGRPIPPRSEEFTRTCMQCFHAIAGLYYLHQNRYISHRFWQPWQLGLKRMLRGPMLQREWFAVEEAFSHNPHFCHYIRSLIGNATSGR